jgi:hypothetical protein
MANLSARAARQGQARTRWRSKERPVPGSRRRLLYGGVVGLIAAASLPALAQKSAAALKDDRARRPKFTLRAVPTVGISPSKVRLTADLVGGANDYMDFYCPTIEWDWGDGTRSEFASDCQPYEAGKSEITRHFSVTHIFREGDYSVNVRLKRNDQVLAVANAKIEID